MAQLAIDFERAPCQSHAATSRAAAELVTPHLGAMQSRVLEFIQLHGPISDNDGAARSGMSPNSYRPRRIELQRKGLIVPDGEANGSTLWKLNDPDKAAARRVNNIPILTAKGIAPGKLYAVSNDTITEVEG